MHSVSDLTTFARKTKGDVPPPLVGASTTVVGNKMYLFGGRLVSLRKMVSDMYIFDLQTFIWTKVEPKPDDPVPGPRYFHSADAWDDHLVVFGGMGYADPASEELCVLSDVRLFSLATLSWLPVAPVQTASDDPANPVPPPRARYAHLSSITASKLFIIGGQDLSNVWLDDIHVYDLPSATWVMWRAYPRHCGTYRSVAVCAARRVRSPMDELKAGSGAGSPPPQGYPFLGPVGARFAPERPSGPNVLRSGSTAAIDTAPDGPTPTKELVHLPYSCESTDEFPNDIYLYSNYNFTDVKRELEVIGPLPNDFTITDRSSSMSGTALPPGLRFPTGAILGQHLVIAGTYLAHSYQSFSIWALDLVNMTWSRIDPGATLASGSWSRGVLWERGNRFLIFGNREGNLVEDYNRRLLSWDHVAYIDLEAFGIYQPPELVLSLAAQEMGLAALEEGVCADFEVVCEDGRRIACSRRLLEERWEWFRDKRREFQENVGHVLGGMRARGDVALPELPGVLVEGDREAGGRPDPRLTSRSLQLSEPYPITLAFLQWIYTQAVITRLQHAPAVLSALLLLGTTYGLKELEKQVKHAMHRALTHTTSVGVYEVATLCDCQSLQIRALKVVMSSSKQRSSARARPPVGPAPGPDEGGARPRGMSDAPQRPARPGDGPSMRTTYGSAPAPSSVLSASTNGYSRHAGAGLHLTMPQPQPEESESDMSNAFAVTTPDADGVGADYFETLHGALEFSPHSAVDPNALSTHSAPHSSPHSSPQPVPHSAPVRPLQHRRQTLDTLPQWKGDSRVVRPSMAADRAPNPNGNFPARPGTQAQASKYKAQPDNQVTGLDYDEMIGVRDESDADARMRRLLNQLESVTQPDLHESDWASSSSTTSTSQIQGVPPYANTRRPSALAHAAFARQLTDLPAARDLVPLRGTEHVLPRDGDIVDRYVEAESRLPVHRQTSQFPNEPQNVTAGPPLPRYKSAPSTPSTPAVAPQPSRSSPPRFTADERDSPAHYVFPTRKLSLVRGRYGGSEQNLRDLSRQNGRLSQPGLGYGHPNSSGNLFLNTPVTPASPNMTLPGLISDSISRSSSFTSLHRLGTPTESTVAIPSTAPYALGRIDEKLSLDHNEIEADQKARQTVLPPPSSHIHIASEAKERQKTMEKRPGLKLATPLASPLLPYTNWRTTPTSAELSVGKHLRSATTTPARSVFDMGDMESTSSIMSGRTGFSRSTMPSGGSLQLQRAHSRSEFSSFTDSSSRTSSEKTNSMKDKVTPTVAAATVFAMTGTMPVGVPLSKAERAAERARQKADKAAKKARAALLKVEREREAKEAKAQQQQQQQQQQEEESKSKRQAGVDAKKREKGERQKPTELAPPIMLFGI